MYKVLTIAFLAVGIIGCSSQTYVPPMPVAVPVSLNTPDKPIPADKHGCTANDWDFAESWYQVKDDFETYRRMTNGERLEMEKSLESITGNSAYDKIQRHNLRNNLALLEGDSIYTDNINANWKAISPACKQWLTKN